jgi:ribosome recycling factor
MSDTSGQLTSVFNDAEEHMIKAIQHLETELVKIRAGRANPNMLDGIVVDYYGSPTPINQVGNISVSDARTITIQPWEKNMLQPIERSIINANIGLTPQNDGNIIRLFLPPLTEERRKELVKRVNGEGEHTKVAIRNIRRDAIEHIKKLQKDGLSEDAAKDAEKDIQDLTNKYTAQIDKHLEAKDKEIMSV